MKTKSWIFALTISLTALFLLGPATAFAQNVPHSLTHQGRLLDDDGEVLTGPVTLTYTLYDAESGGAVLWEQDITVNIDQSGTFSTTLGDDDNPIDSSVLADGNVWMGVAVDGGSELSPRIGLNSVPFALRADTAGHADQADTADLAMSVAPGSVGLDALGADVDLSVDEDQFIQNQFGQPQDASFSISGDAEVQGMFHAPNWPVASGYTSVTHAAGNRIEYEHILVNNGGHYDTVTHFFTAPVDGVYEMCVTAYRSGDNWAYISTEVENEYIFENATNGIWLGVRGNRSRHSSGCISFEASQGNRIGNYVHTRGIDCGNGYCSFNIKLLAAH